MYCCEKCRLDRAAWTQRRGAKLVDLLINGDMLALETERRRLIEETTGETP